MNSTSENEGRLVLGVPREIVIGERRVALIPDVVLKLTGAGLEVLIESDAGCEAAFPDHLYREAGADIASDAADLYRRADVVAKVQAPTDEELGLLHSGQVLIGFLDPLRYPDRVERLRERGVTAISMDAIPRITRAQSMDALSSMSTVAGYKAVLLAAGQLPRFFPMLTTAAGTITPARALVLGVGVAGLQALATARRLGAVTEAFDTRPAAAEQAESVGATFIQMPIEEETEGEGGYAREMSSEFYRREQDAIRDHLARADVVITTALIPGKPAPILITAEMVGSMRPGSVIVDLASEAGGNCEVSVPGETIVYEGVSIMAPRNLPASVPTHASQMYARNVTNLLLALIKDGRLHLDPEDEIVQGACVTARQEVLP